MDDKRNMTLRIDPSTRDIPLDDEGSMELIYGDDTTAQAVRLTLQTWKEEFPLDTTHGTEYDRILGKKPHELEEDEVGEVIREAIFQETDVAQVGSLETAINGRALSVAFTGTLYSGQTISTEVTV